MRRLKGWRRVGVAVSTGAVSALAFAPFGLFPLLLLGLAALVLLIDVTEEETRPIRAAARVGWWFGFGQFLGGLHWIGNAFMVDAADHAWQLPFVALLFPGGLALFTAAGTAAARALWRPGASRLFTFAVCYGVSEWLRGHLFTGFPWNIAGYGWGASLAVLQSTAVFGVYTLSVLTALLGASLAEFFVAPLRWRVPAAMMGLFVLFWIGGVLRLAAHPTTYVPGVALRVVQPDIPQTEKFRRDLVGRNWARLTDLSTRPAKHRLNAVIWPEAAPPFLITYAPTALEWVADLNSRGSLLMTGAIRVDWDGVDEPRYYNSFYVFAQGRVAATYDKSHLVPFGEYLPFEETLNAWGIQKLTGIKGSFARGDGPATLRIPGLPAVGPLICYEILFPGEVTGVIRPDWFVNVTDDSWFGSGAGPRQHLMVAQVRAIEEGIPVVRAANTGISAVIDPMGRTLAQTPMNTQAVLDVALPAKNSDIPLAHFQFLWFWSFVGGFFVLSRFLPRRK